MGLARLCARAAPLLRRIFPGGAAVTLLFLIFDRYFVFLYFRVIVHPTYRRLHFVYLLFRSGNLHGDIFGDLLLTDGDIFVDLWSTDLMLDVVVDNLCFRWSIVIW